MNQRMARLLAGRALRRAAEAADDASLAFRDGKLSDAEALLRESRRHAQDAINRIREATGRSPETRETGLSPLAQWARTSGSRS